MFIPKSWHQNGDCGAATDWSCMAGSQFVSIPLTVLCWTPDQPVDFFLASFPPVRPGHAAARAADCKGQTWAAGTQVISQCQCTFPCQSLPCGFTQAQGDRDILCRPATERNIGVQTCHQGQHRRDAGITSQVPSSAVVGGSSPELPWSICWWQQWQSSISGCSHLSSPVCQRAAVVGRGVILVVRAFVWMYVRITEQTLPSCWAGKSSLSKCCKLPLLFLPEPAMTSGTGHHHRQESLPPACFQQLTKPSLGIPFDSEEGGKNKN